MEKNKIAIACQGGGSQTAFTAGVLKSFFDNDIHHKKEIVSLSGTSGGAVCATLAWYSLIKASQGDTKPMERRLMEFWKDNSTQNMYEKFYNSFAVKYIQYADMGWIPRWETSPSSFPAKAMLSISTSMLPRRNFYDFKSLLETHVNFEEIRSWGIVSSPALLLGAANVKTGEFKKFSSIKGEIQVEAILASAAVPSIFPAVKIGESSYWDGLFSDNPPTEELLDSQFVGDNMPDEIWIIQINPKTSNAIPVKPQDIIDRRNEMIGNESLFQDIQKIDLINRLLKENAFTEEFLAKRKTPYKQIKRHFIEMSPEVHESLDYASKLNRDSEYIDYLIRDGEKQGREFLEKNVL